MYSNNENNVEINALYAEQNYLNKQQDFLDNLKNIKKLLYVPGKIPPFCYIVHASPTEENKNTESWVEPFLNTLYDHLAKAGIRVSMDTRDVGPGESMYKYIEGYYDRYVILVGTESLLQKHSSHKDHIEKSALAILSRKVESDKRLYGQSRICSLLISGSFETSFDKFYGSQIDAPVLGYIETVQYLLSILYEKLLTNETVISKYNAISDELNKLKIMTYTPNNNVGINLHATPDTDDRKQINNNNAKEIQVNTFNSMEYTPAPYKMEFVEYGKQFQRPQVNNFFVDRQKIRKQIIEYFRQLPPNTYHILYVYGLGGSGKSAMIEDYYFYPPEPYPLRAWFNAENKEQLYLQYIELAKMYGFISNEKLPIKQQALLIKMWLEEQKGCLFVYDNVHNIKNIEELLPENIYNHIIITSRMGGGIMSYHRSINIDVMEEDEALALIGKYIKIDEQLDKVKELVRMLGYIPLALAQAGAFMIERQTPLDEYIRIYQKYKSFLMNEVLTLGPKHEPIWVTYDRDIETLKEQCLEAYYTLVRASFIDEYTISEFSLKSFLDGPDKDLMWADIKRYINYHSLMRFDPEHGKLFMNPLLKDIISTKL